jgi:hypothetical protein
MARQEFKKQLEEAEAQGAMSSAKILPLKAGPSVGLTKERKLVQTPKFNGSASWAMLKHQFKTMAEHSS